MPDLREEYGNLCAYLALYIHHATGSATVDQYCIGPPEGIALARLERHAPFIAQELRRQGLMVRGDT